jgi:hypothetical protein
MHHEIRDLRGLAPEMVEVQDGGVRLPAIRTTSAIEDRANVVGVAPAARACRSRCTASACGAPAVTADANDLAEFDLRVEPGWGGAVVGELREVPALASHVVELQYDRVGLAAVDARVSQEMRQEMSFCAQPACGPCGAGLRSMKLAAVGEVRPRATTTPVLPAPECADRKK